MHDAMSGTGVEGSLHEATVDGGGRFGVVVGIVGALEIATGMHILADTLVRLDSSDRPPAARSPHELPSSP